MLRKKGRNNLYEKKNPPVGENFLKSPLKGPTQESENLAQNVGLWASL